MSSFSKRLWQCDTCHGQELTASDCPPGWIRISPHREVPITVSSYRHSQQTVYGQDFCSQECAIKPWVAAVQAHTTVSVSPEQANE